MTRLCARLGCCLLAMAAAGCDDRAIEFARQTKALLAQRSDQLARKIAGETEAYNQAAAVAGETYRDLIDSSLRNERNERAASLAADYQEGRKPISLWHATAATAKPSPSLACTAGRSRAAMAATSSAGRVSKRSVGRRAATLSGSR